VIDGAGLAWGCANEADTWLEELEQGNDIEPPACHV